jgi:glycosyltransferase involved in cell wall biosynthesis
MKDSVSIIIPAYNEELDIATAIKTAIKFTTAAIADYEIVVINDGSTDGTAEEISKLAAKNKRIKVVTHKTNLGFGQTIRDAVNTAGKTYITGLPADVDYDPRALTAMIRSRKKADIVSTYVTNLKTRALHRQILSVGFVKLMNFLFGLHLRYYNGYFISRVDLLKKITLKSDGYTILAEAKIRLIKKGYKFTEIPFQTRPRQHGVSKALGWKNIIQTLHIIPVLVKDIYF